MAIISCPECGKQISDRAAACPDCGCPINAVPVAPVAETKTNELEKFLMLARRAKDDNNAENAKKYYDMVLLQDATNWEAAFYVVYFKAVECKIAQIQSAAHSVENCLGSVVQLIKEFVADQSEQLIAVTEVQLRCKLIANMFYNGAENHYDGIDSSIKDNYLQEVVDNTCAARDILYTCGSVIDTYFGDVSGFGAIAAAAWKEGIAMHKKILPRLANHSSNMQVIKKYTKEIGKYDAAYLNAFEKEENEKKLREEFQSLQSKVISLGQTISNTKTTRGFSCLGYLLLVVGGVMTFFGMMLLSIDPDQSWALVVGLISFASAFIVGRESRKTVDDRCEAVQKARAELPEAEEKLAKFKNEHPNIR